MRRISIVCAALAALAVACSSSSGPSLDPTHTNCSNVCQKAHDCVSSSSNVDQCTNNCVSKSNSDNVYKASIGDCADCVEPKACTDATQCAGQCLNAVLPTT